MSIKISIRDYQSIESLELDISGFTCITGPTNIGKSAVVRAISSAILNKSVVGAVRKGKKFCTVEVDGLKWEKGERVGRYWVPGEKDESGHPKPRDGIGQGQTEVTEIMGFRSVKVGDKYINPWLATQFNPVFLMEDSGPAVTDFISDIAHLKSLQNAIVHCTRARSRLLTSVKDREEELISLTKKEEALSGIDNLRQAEKDLLAQAESLADYADVIARLRSLIEAAEAEKRAIAALSDHPSVKVPKKPADPSDSLSPGARLWVSMETAAVSILAVKPVTKVTVPDAADTGPVEEMRSLSRFLAIPSLTRSVEALMAVKSVSVPEPSAGGTALLRRAAELSRSISVAARSVESLSAEAGGDLPAYDDAPLLAARAAARTELALRETGKHVASGEAEAARTRDELASVEDELARIPKCPTCKQVFAGPHAHAASG